MFVVWGAQENRISRSLRRGICLRIFAALQFSTIDPQPIDAQSADRSKRTEWGFYSSTPPHIKYNHFMRMKQCKLYETLAFLKLNLKALIFSNGQKN
jgi:hypothetical protein